MQNKKISLDKKPKSYKKVNLKIQLEDELEEETEEKETEIDNELPQEEYITIDQAYNEVGGFGKYQKLVWILV